MAKHISRSWRRVFVRLPSRKTVIRYKKRKPKKAKCPHCGEMLHGVPRERPYKMKRLPKTKKRPERPYPYLCAKCMKEFIKEKIFSEVNKNV